MPHLYFIKPLLSAHLSNLMCFPLLLLPLSLLLSLSQYRAVLCQRCGVGTSHLLLLQRDSHGVQLPGEGIEVILMKTYSLFLLNFHYSHRGIAGLLRASFKRPVEEYVNVSLKCTAMKGAAAGLTSLCCYYLNVNINSFPHSYTDLSSSYLFVCISNPTNHGVSKQLMSALT